MKNIEYLSEDILEEDFLRIFAPYHFIQKILGSCRVDARDRFVTASTKWQKLYTLFYITGIFFLNFRIISQFYRKNFVEYPYIYYLVLMVLLTQIIICLLNFIHIRFRNAQENVIFFIKMQEIDRLMQIERGSIIYDLQYKSHLFSVAFQIIIYIGLIVGCSLRDLEITLLLVVLICSESPFAIEMSSCSNLMLYFAIRVRMINAIISNHLYGEVNVELFLDRIALPTKDYLRSIAAKTYDFKTSKVDYYLQQILQCFTYYQDLYRLQVFMLCSKFFLYIIYSFEYFLLTTQNNTTQLAPSVILTTMCVMDLMTILFICIRCEIFFRSVKDTKVLTVSVMAVHFDGPIREKAKRIYKMIDETPPRFSVYDMWDMRAQILLKMFSIITGFMVTLLQFAVL